MSSLRARTARFGLAAALALVAGAARAETPLKWSLKQGDTLKYAFLQVNEIKVDAQGQQVSNKSELNVSLSWKVKSVDGAGVVDLEQTVDRAQAKITANGMELNYDSQSKTNDEAPATQALGKVYDAVVGKPYAIKLSARGEILDVKIPPEVAKALAGSPFAGIADSGSFLSSLGVKNMLAQVLPPLPEAPADKGATWKNTLTLPSGPLQMKLDTKYTVAAIAPLAAIDATIDTSISAAADAPFSVKINKQTGTGKFSFDPAAGVLADSAIDQSFDMTIKVGDREIAQTIAIVAKLKLVK